MKSQNQISTSIDETIHKIKNNDPTLTDLNLCQNQIDNAGVIKIAEALEKNFTKIDNNQLLLADSQISRDVAQNEEIRKISTVTTATEQQEVIQNQAPPSTSIKSKIQKSVNPAGNDCCTIGWTSCKKISVKVFLQVREKLSDLDPRN